MSHEMPGDLSHETKMGMRNPTSCQNEVHRIWDRLEAEMGSEGTTALRTFAATGEISPDLPEDIVGDLRNLESVYSGPEVEKAIKNIGGEERLAA